MPLPHNARAFLEQQQVGRLATADADGAPHVVPVCFALVDDAVYIVIDRKPKSTTRLKRIRNIQENPRAALVVDFYDQDWSRLAWVMLRGSATVLAGDEEAGRAIAALRAKYPQYREMNLDGRPVIRLAAQHVASWGLA